MVTKKVAKVAYLLDGHTFAKMCDPKWITDQILHEISSMNEYELSTLASYAAHGTFLNCSNEEAA